MVNYVFTCLIIAALVCSFYLFPLISKIIKTEEEQEQDSSPVAEWIF